MGITPWELDGYTPRELSALIAYANAKKQALESQAG